MPMNLGLGLGLSRRAGTGEPAPGPINSVAPVVSGTPEIGEELTTTDGSWTGTGTITYAYQWLRDGSNISGAEANTYTLVSGDDLTTVSCRVTATDDDGSRSAVSNGLAVTYPEPVNTVAPAVTGTTAIGDTLTSDTGTWTGGGLSYSYQWQRDTVDIDGATSSTYELVLADDGASIRCVVTATNSGGAVSANSNAVTAGVTPFTPADLFQSSEPGFWAPVTASRLWQDTARTTPVTTTGDPIASWELTTASGVIYATQSTAGNRPTYFIDANGRECIRFGSSKALSTPTITPGTDKMQAFLTMSTSGTGTQIFMEFSPTTDSNNGTFALFQAIGNTKYRSKGTTLQDANLTIPTPPDQYVLTGLGDISGDSAILRKDGVQVASNTGDQGTGNYGAYQLFIGARSPASLSALGDFYGAIVRFGPALTTQELDDAEAWMDDLRNP